MPIFQHEQMPIYDVPRIRTRIVVGDGSGAESTAVWEQWISADGYIPLHYHEEEEVIVLLEGRISITLGENQDAVCGPSTIVIPAREIHGLRPVGPEEVHLLGFFPVTSPKIYAPDGALRPLPWEDRAESEAPP